MKDILFRSAEGILFKLLNRCTFTRENVYILDSDGQDGMTTLLDPYFYKGYAGLIFFLSNYYKESRDQYVLKLMLKAINTELELLNRAKAKVGFYDGLAGVIFVLMSVNEVLEWQFLSHRINGFANYVVHNPPSRRDLISGHAGILVNFLSAYPSYLKGRFIKSLGDDLVEQATRIDRKAYWPDSSQKFGNTGLAHGNAGIILALELLKKHFGETPKLRELILAGLRFNESKYCNLRKNWEDLRFLPSGFTSAWCHGAPGILLAYSKLDGYDVHSQPNWDQASQVSSSGQNCLCHGNLGNALIRSRLYQNKGDLNIALQSWFDYRSRNLAEEKNFEFSYMLGDVGIADQMLFLSTKSDRYNPFLLGSTM